MIRHYAWAIIQNVLLFALCIPLIILGVVVVPLALLWPDDSQMTATYKTDGNFEWWLRTLSPWASWWDNPYDGFLGDDAFRWASRDVPFGWRNTFYRAQCAWGAFRNPLHRLKSFLLACDIRRCTFLLLAGKEFVRDRPDSTGYQFALATRSDGVRYYRIYWVWQWPTKVVQVFAWLFGAPLLSSPWSLLVKDRAAIIEIGHEFRRDHWYQDYSGRDFKNFKGFAFLIHPCKPI